jgi:hypothetical protein
VLLGIFGHSGSFYFWKLLEKISKIVKRNWNKVVNIHQAWYVWSFRVFLFLETGEKKLKILNKIK